MISTMAPSCQHRQAVKGGSYLKQWRQYQLIRELGKGGTSHVYLAADKADGRKFAVKRYETSEDFLSAKREFQLMQKLCHPGIACVFERISEKEGGAIVMEYVPGSTLKERIVRQGKISEPEAVSWGIELCDILAYLHRQQPAVLYRDLKPSNIMITPAGHVKLIDFGAALCCDWQGEAVSDAVGTRGYAAPEQFVRQRALGMSVDVYGFGATMFHMLTGRCPGSFTGKVPASEKMKAVMSKCMQKKPENRYRFFEEIKRDLEYPGVPRTTSRGFQITRSEIRC